MKKLVVALLMVVSMTAYAQQRPNRNTADRPNKERMADLSPQQRAELRTKRMTLHLNLTESQQKKVQKLNETMETNREKTRLDPEARKSMTQEERYAHKNARLDEEIAFKRQLKEILTEDQFATFEKSRRHKEEWSKKHSKRKNR